VFEASLARPCRPSNVESGSNGWHGHRNSWVVPSNKTVEWRLCRDNAHVVCERQDTSKGIEVSVTFSGLPTAQYLTSTLREAHDWIRRVRERWEAAGWQLAS
jgi:hypothetical protein